MATSSEPRRSLTGYRIALAAVAIMILVILALLPISVFSAFRNIVTPPYENENWLTPEPAGVEDIRREGSNLVSVELLTLDEIQQLVTIRVTAVHFCTIGCTYRERITVFSGDEELEAGLGLVPPSESITVPPDRSVVMAQMRLPLVGNLIHYPFDQYKLELGMRLDRELPDKSLQRVSPEESRGRIHVLVQSFVPRVRLQEPRDLTDVQPTVPAGPYNVLGGLTLERPIYLKVLVPSVIVLLAAAGAYAVFMRPFDQLIINAGALVLGVWGARALLLGSYPPDVTAVDTALTAVILFLLMAISFRAAHYLQARSGLESLPWRRPKLPPDPPAPEDTPLSRP